MRARESLPPRTARGVGLDWIGLSCPIPSCLALARQQTRCYWFAAGCVWLVGGLDHQFWTHSSSQVPNLSTLTHGIVTAGDPSSAAGAPVSKRCLQTRLLMSAPFHIREWMRGWKEPFRPLASASIEMTGMYYNYLTLVTYR